MNAVEAMQAAIDALERSQIDYMVVGSLASSAYGVSRSTQDVDFVIHATPEATPRLVAEMRAGFDFEPQKEFEMVTITTKLKFREKESKFVVEVFQLSSDSFDQSRFSRRVRHQLLSRDAWVMTPEDVVVQKLLWLSLVNRYKDEADVKEVLVIQKEKLDFTYIRHWCAELGITELLNQILAQLFGHPDRV